jgi:hypothetical protein
MLPPVIGYPPSQYPNHFVWSRARARLREIAESDVGLPLRVRTQQRRLLPQAAEVPKVCRLLQHYPSGDNIRERNKKK